MLRRVIPPIHKHASLKKRLLWFVLIAAIIIPVYVFAMPYANKTSNWSVESWGGSYSSYNGYPLQVASNWHRFTQSGTEPRFMRDDVYADTFSGSGAIERHIEGNYSQNLWLGHPFTAGIYQQIGVTSGKPYAAKSWFLSVYRTSASQTHGRILKQVGIDPYGGTDPSSSNVVWGESDGQDVEFVDVRTAATAKSSTVTLFVRVTSPYAVYPDWNAAWMDAIVLAQAPTVSASSPEFSASTSFTVSWNNAQAAPNGSLMGRYDVQYKDGVDGEWVTWKNKKSSTSDTFTGQIGHTYYFRARAWQEYDPEGIELYGAYSEEGDTHTTVGRTVTGYVRGNKNFAIKGATVAISGTTTSTTTDSNGKYQLALPGVGDYGLTASSPYYNPSLAVPFTVAPDSFMIPITLTLRPLDDAVSDGDFEESLSAHWTASGSPLPQTQTQELHSGARSLSLRNAAEAGQSRVEQSFAIAGMYEPLLSFYAKIPEMGSGDYLIVGRTTTALDDTPLLTIMDTYSEWTHFWVPLDVGEVYTGSLGVFFQAVQTGSAPMEVYLDQVSVGRSPGGPIKCYFPIIVKEF